MGFALEKPITDPSQRGLPYDREMQRILSTVVLLVLASCGGEIRSCTVAGAASEVTVSSDSRVAVTDMCLDSLCHPIDFWDGRELIDDEPRTYEYELTVIIDGTERVLAGEVETKEFWVNGEGCEPKTANAHLHVEADGSVTVQHLG